jgi:transposase-like protein
MKQLHRAIGDPPGLVISSDACKGLEKSIELVFPNCENRECMRHLYSNFMKKFHGKVYTENRECMRHLYSNFWKANFARPCFHL